MSKPDIKSIDTNSLRLFLAVYDTGSLTGAAKVLGIKQSTASHGLQKLRDIFDDQLFVKSGRGIVPTDRVNELIPRVRSLLPQLTSLLQTEGFDPAEEDRPIVIGTNGACRAHIATRIFSGEEMRGVSLQFVVAGSGRNIEDTLVHDKADLVISSTEHRFADHIRRKRLFGDRMKVFYDADHTSAPADIAEYCSARHAVIDYGNGNLSLVDLALGKAGVTRTVALRVPEIEALPSLMKGTRLIATMPSLFSDNLFSGLASCEPPVEMPEFSYDMLWHVRSDNSPRNKWLQQLILSAVEMPGG